MPLMQPIPNLNGTSRSELIRMRIKAVNALREAMEAMQDLHPHHRDYIGNREARDRDYAIHAQRFAALSKMEIDLMDEAVRLSENA